MSENRKLTVPEMVKDINEIHDKEKAIFPADVASLAPARNYIADKLIKATILKQMDEDLKLFDCYKHEDELKLKQKERVYAYIAQYSFLKLPVIITTIYLLCKRASIFHLESYNKHLLPILGIFAGSYFYFQFAKRCMIDQKIGDISDDREIYMTRAHLHSTAVKLANSLNIPNNELH